MLLPFNPPTNAEEIRANILARNAAHCPCCEAEAPTQWVTAFMAYGGGWIQTTKRMCILCAEEFDRGNNPIYKPQISKAA